jgi:hypothetical protein
MRYFNLLIEDLKTQNDWYVNDGGYSLRNKRNTLAIRIGGGPLVFPSILNPPCLKLSLWEKYRLRKAVQQVLRAYVLSELKRNQLHEN